MNHNNNTGNVNQTQEHRKAPAKAAPATTLLSAVVSDQDQEEGLDFDFLDDVEKEKFEQYRKQFQEYALLNLNGKTVILKIVDDPIGIRYEFSSLFDFRNFHRQENFKINESNNPRYVKEKTLYFANIWLENKSLRTRYETTIFDPSCVFQKSNVFNFWTGYIEPIKGDVTPFTDHINKLIDGTPEQKQHLINLLAYAVRYPELQLGTSIALRGEQGAGKTTVSEIIKKICPNHWHVVDDVEDLFGFNSETLHTKFFLCEESVWGGYRSQEGRLKSLLTSQHRNIGIKGITSMKTVNYGFFIFTSNSSWMIPVGKGDRRFNVYDCTKTLIDNRKYFNEFYAWLDGNGKHAILHHFLHDVDLTNFDPRATIETQAKTEIKTLSLEPMEKFLFNLLDGNIDCEVIDKQNWNTDEVQLKRNTLYELFLENGGSSKTDKGMLSKKLAVIFDFPKKWQDNWRTKKNGSFYRLRVKHQCQSLFAEFIKEKPENLFPNYLDLLLQADEEEPIDLDNPFI